MKVPRIVWVLGAAGGLYALYQARDKIRAMLALNTGISGGLTDGTATVGGKPIAKPVPETTINFTDDEVDPVLPDDSASVRYGTNWDGGPDRSG